MAAIDPRLLEPYHFPGDETGCLLIHGFSGSPLDLLPLGHYLRDQGYTVRGMVLPGHCTNPEDMARYDGQDWLEAVEAELDILSRECRTVWVLGHSMGGILACITATRQKVSGVVSIAAPIWPWARLTQVAFAFKYLRRHIFLRPRPRHDIPSWRYNAVPVKSIADLMTLVRRAKRILPAVQVPLLVLQGDRDKTVQPRSANYIFSRAGSTKKELVWVPGGGHLLLVEPRHQQTCAQIGAFLSQQMGGTTCDKYQTL